MLGALFPAGDFWPFQARNLHFANSLAKTDRRSGAVLRSIGPYTNSILICADCVVEGPV